MKRLLPSPSLTTLLLSTLVTLNLPQPGEAQAPSTRPPLAASFYRHNIEQLNQRRDLLRDGAGRVLFDRNLRVVPQQDPAAAGAPLDGNSPQGSPPPTSKERPLRLLVRLTAPAPEEKVAARVDAEIAQIVSENGGDWENRRPLASPLPRAASAASDTESSGQALADAYQRTFLIPVADTAALIQLQKALQAAPGVEFVQPSFPYRSPTSPQDTPQDTTASPRTAAATLARTSPASITPAPWGIDAVRARQAWALSRGRGVTVAILDTGVNYTHAQLRDQIWRNPAEIPNNCIDDDANGFIDDVAGWSFADQLNQDSWFSSPRIPYTCPGGVPIFNDPIDFNARGSQMAGIVAAAGKDSSVIGVAPNATIMPVKVLDDYGDGQTEGLAAGIVYAAANGAQVITGAWEKRPYFPVAYESDYLLSEAIQFAAARGAVVVSGVGDAAINGDSSVSPQRSTQLISVGALRRATDDFKPTLSLYGTTTPPTAPPNSRLTLASFSNRGLDVDIAAPGVQIQSTSGYICPGNFDISCDNLSESSTFDTLSGTAAAASHVAGVAALVRATNPGLSAAEVRSILLMSARRSERVLGPDPLFGSGVLDAEQAVQMARRGRAPTITISSPREIVTAPGSGTLDVRGSIRNALFYRSVLYSYDTLFGSDRSVVGTELGIRTGIPIGSDSVLLRVPLRGLKSGRYALSISATSANGRTTTETIPFAVDGPDAVVLADLSLNEDLACLRAKGDWVVWYESSVDRVLGDYQPDLWRTAVVSLRAANVRTGERTTLFTFEGGEGTPGERSYRELSASCPQLLDDGTVAWITSNRSWWSIFVEAGRGDSYRTALYRANLTTKQITSAALPDVPWVVEDLRDDTLGASHNGSDLTFISDDPHFAPSSVTAPDGTPYYIYTGTTTRVHYIPAGSMSATTLSTDERSWQLNTIAGPLSSGSVSVVGARTTESQEPGDLPAAFALNIALADGSLSPPGWFTPTVAEQLLPYYLTFSPAERDLVAVINRITPAEAPPLRETRLQPGLSLLNLRSNLTFPIFTRGKLSTAALDRAQLVWGESGAVLGLPRIEGLSLRSGTRFSQDPGFISQVTGVAATSRGLVAAGTFRGRSVRAYNRTR